MKKILYIFILLFVANFSFAQELNAQIQVDYSQIGGSNTQTFKTLEKSLRDFINKTSWTGKKYQNFEKIKCGFALVLSEKNGNNYKGTLTVQSVRPVYGTQYETPILNIQDQSFSFEYLENQNLVFNERQFSGKNLIDVISYYVYLILAYDADTFQLRGGTQWFDMALKIAQNSQNQQYGGWSQMEGPRNRGSLIAKIEAEENRPLRNFYYIYHRTGLDNLGKADQTGTKQVIANELLKLKVFENDFQLNYPFNLFIDTKKDEIFNIFDSNNNGGVNMNELKNLMNTFSPKDNDNKWSKWK